MNYPNISDLLIGLLFSVILGGLVMLLLHFLSFKIIEYKYPEVKSIKHSLMHLTILIGVFERIIYTIFFAYEVSAVGAFVGTWILAKMVTGWNRYTKDKPEYKALGFNALILNVISLLFGFLGALISQDRIHLL